MQVARAPGRSRTSASPGSKPGALPLSYEGRDTRGELSSKIGFATLAAAVAILAAAGVAGASPSAGELRALLVGAGVPLERGSTPTAASFPAAWTTFRRFAPVCGPGGDIVYEFGVFESKDYGTSFEVELTRRYADRRQVHLLVHFPVAAFIAITRKLRATPCLAGDGCVFRCFFASDDALVPHPCKIASRDTGGYRIGDMTLRASQTGGRARWIDGVESSPVFRALLSRHVRPDGYEVWQE